MYVGLNAASDSTILIIFYKKFNCANVMYKRKYVYEERGGGGVSFWIDYFFS